jgi:hypothetical protein
MTTKSMGVFGLKPYTISNGHIFVVECTTLLYANSTCGKHSSHSIKFFFITARNSIESVRFTTLVCPSLCGWHVVENSSLVPSSAQGVFQK